jgi:N-acetylmuramic acid 6-phosphate etherase
MTLEQLPDRSHILTEHRNQRTSNLHSLSAAECIALIQQEDRAILDALEEARPSITAFIEAAEPRFCGWGENGTQLSGGGGRLIYIGAGTSGRLGVLDASEAPPTFQVEPGRIVGIIAGGDAALRRSSEGQEDLPDGAHADIDRLGLTWHDTVLGIAAGGTTPYVLGALRYVKQGPNGGDRRRPLTGLLVCSPIERPPDVDHLIVVATGPEVIAGSTRMKAGTATKLVLNTISTTLMVRSGRVYQNLMVDLRATNQKLLDRAIRIVSALTALSREDATTLIGRAGGHVKVAVVMNRLGVDRAVAEQQLAEAGWRLDGLLDEE